MGFDSQKCFAQVNKDGDVENGIWVQVVCLNAAMEKKYNNNNNNNIAFFPKQVGVGSAMEKKSVEKIKTWNPKTTQDIIFKNNGFLVSFMRRNIS